MELQHSCVKESNDKSPLFNLKEDNSPYFNANSNDNSPMDLSCHKRRQQDQQDPTELSEKFQGVRINPSPPATNPPGQLPWQQLQRANQQLPFGVFPTVNLGLSNQLALNFIKQIYPDWLLTSFLRQQQQAEMRNGIVTSSQLRHRVLPSSFVTSQGRSSELQRQVARIKQKREEDFDSRRKSLVPDFTEGEKPESIASCSSVSPSQFTNDSGF